MGATGDRREEIRRLREQLSAAERAYRRRVQDARRALDEAERAYRTRLDAARRREREAARSYERRVADAHRALEAARKGRLLAQLGPVRLYDDRLETPCGTEPLARSIKAKVRASGRKTQKHDGRTLTLHVSTPRFECAVRFDPDDRDRVRGLATGIAAAARQAAALHAEHEARLEAAEHALVAARAEDGGVREASAATALAEADTRGRVAARTARDTAEADTSQVEAARAALLAADPTATLRPVRPPRALPGLSWWRRLPRRRAILVAALAGLLVVGVISALAGGGGSGGTQRASAGPDEASSASPRQAATTGTDTAAAGKAATTAAADAPTETTRSSTTTVAAAATTTRTSKPARTAAATTRSRAVAARRTGARTAATAVTGTAPLVVSRVLDGDTLVLANGSRIRLLQIDAPELAGGECYGRAAAAALAAVVPPGSRVRLVTDPRLDRRDRYGRLLRYVVTAGRANVNLLLVRWGAAAPYFYRGATGTISGRLYAAALAARRGRLGLWAACPATRLRPTAAVATLAARPAPVARPAPSRSSTTRCHPSYQGECLDPSSPDYDCAGGSGNGPDYVSGTVRVVGPDVYRLDADGDGLGCE